LKRSGAKAGAGIKQRTISSSFVARSACGAGYGDGGQHEQSQWWLDALGIGGRKTVSYDVPAAGARGKVPAKWNPLPIGKAALAREGTDIGFIGVSMDVQRAFEAA
jgi:hypothetical protein